MATYPAVLLSLPLWRVAVDLSARRAVGKLEKAGEHAVDLCSVREDGVLKVHSMRDEIVVLIHPARQRRKRYTVGRAKNEYEVKSCACVKTQAEAHTHKNKKLCNI